MIKNNIETRTLKNLTKVYRAVVSYSDAQGKQQNLYSPTFRTEKDAKQALKGLKQQVKDIKKKYAAEITPNSKLVDAYLIYYDRYKRNQHEILTTDEWMQSLAWYRKYFGDVRLKALSEASIKRVALEYGEKHSTGSDGALAKHLMHLRAFLDQAVHLKAIPANPLPPKYLTLWFGDGVRRKQDNNNKRLKLIRLFTVNEIAEIRSELLKVDYTQDATRTASKIALLIMAYTGMRPEEVQALTPDDIVRSANGQIKFFIHDSYNNKYQFMNGRTKNLVERHTVALPMAATKAVENYLAAQKVMLERWKLSPKNPLLLLNVQNPKKTEQQLPITQATINKQLKIIAKRVGIERTDVAVIAYTLRHTFATELSTKVQGKYEIAATLMGHTTHQYIKTYLHAQTDEVENLADTMFA